MPTQTSLWIFYNDNFSECRYSKSDFLHPRFRVQLSQPVPDILLTFFLNSDREFMLIASDISGRTVPFIS